MQWKVISERPLYQDEWLDIRIADIELPDGRHLAHRSIRTPAGAGVVAVSKDGRVLLIWRHRYITGTWGWEIPIGKIEPGETPPEAAAREFEEETGWRPGPLRSLLTVLPTPGLSTSTHHIYRADSATHVGKPADGFESERIAWMPLGDLRSLIAKGHITSGTTVRPLDIGRLQVEPLGAASGTEVDAPLHRHDGLEDRSEADWRDRPGQALRPAHVLVVDDRARSALSKPTARLARPGSIRFSKEDRMLSLFRPALRSIHQALARWTENRYVASFKRVLGTPSSSTPSSTIRWTATSLTLHPAHNEDAVHCSAARLSRNTRTSARSSRMSCHRSTRHHLLDSSARG